MQKTQPKSPSFASIGQTGQQISNLFILVAQLWAVTIAGLTNRKSPAGQRNADTSSFDRRSGHLAAVRWPNYFFPRATFNKSACILRSAYIRFSLRFYALIGLH